MQEDDLHVLEGHVHALAMTLSELIAHLPPQSAARMAIDLAAAADVQLEADIAQSTPPAAVRARAGLLQAFVAALESAVPPRG